MKLRAIRLHNVRRFTDRGIAIEGIDDGVNVLAESNEYGKSTIFDAVHALFFQSHKGKPKAIQLMQPYSKGAITVEADIDTPEGAVRLRKRWYGAALAQVSDIATGRIIAQADQADRWIDEKIRGGATGPAGLLWVQQGVVEMGQGTGKTVETEKAAREDVLTSVSGEIETLTGGRRTTQVLAKCSAELDAYVTATGKAKKGGAYDSVLQELEMLTARADDLSARVSTLRTDLENRSRSRKRLAELQDPARLAQDTKALADADAALKLGEDQAGKLEKAILTETLAKQERDTAHETLERFDLALTAVSELKQRIAEEQERRDAAHVSHADAKRAEEDAIAAVNACRLALEKTEAELVVARAASDAREAAVRLEERRQTLSDADTAHREADSARAKAKAVGVPESEIGALTKLEETISGLNAAMRASSVSVRVAYSDSDKRSFVVNGSPLADGAEVSVENPTRFDVEGVGSLTVAPGAGDRSSNLGSDLWQVNEKRAALLGSLGVHSLDAARRRQSEAADHVRQAERSETRRDTLAPQGIDTLRVEVERLGARVDDAPTANESVDDVIARRDAARVSRGKAEGSHASALAVLRERERTLISLDANLRRSKESMISASSALNDQTDADESRRSLVAILADKSTQFEEANRIAITLRKTVPDIATLTAAQKRAASVLQRSREEADSLDKAIHELNGSIGARAEEGIEEDLASTLGHRDRASSRVAEVESEITTLLRLHDVLRDAKADAKEHFFEPVLKELKPLLELVFGDAMVTFDEVTMLPVTIERDGAVESFDVLSGGMREQVTILTRLAFARLLAQDGRTVPVILDDALIYSDDERIERMFTALHRQADDLQILVFTCRQRAFQRLGGRALSTNDWTPAQ